jgi:hypothetical protein
MKKIIALLVVFALFAGSAFAVDLGGAVNGSVTLFSGSSVEDSDILASGGMDRIRIEGAGQTDDGVFGGWIRQDGGWHGLAWWQPIDALKVIIGGNPDGHWGKEGVTGWMLQQTAYDTSAVTNNQDNVWGGDGLYGWNSASRRAFFGGDGFSGLRLEITPLDILAIKVGLPIFSDDGAKLEDVFKKIYAQLDLNFAFANIAVTYRGDEFYIQNPKWDGTTGGTIYGYVGLPLGIINLDVGIGLQMNDEDGTKHPVWAGLGLKAGLSDLFALKLRAYAGFGGEDSDPFTVTADLLPYLTLNDNLRVGVAVGFAMASFDNENLYDKGSVLGFNVNPYIEVGQEWGPKFLAGFKLTNTGKGIAGEDAVTTWSFGFGIQSSF